MPDSPSTESNSGGQNSPSSPPTSAPPDSIADELKRKLEGAIALKDYAISKNFDVPDDAIERLNKAAETLIKDDQPEQLSRVADNIDKAIRDLTALTYPATVDTVVRSYKDSSAFREFFRKLLRIGCVALVCAIGSYVFLTLPDGSKQTGPLVAYAAASVLATSLGLLGCFTYIVFNIIGILSEKAFELEDRLSNYARLLLGAILGWVFYFAFARDAFTIPTPPKTSTTQSQFILLLLPFVVGFSTRLVVGLLNQVIRAIESTLALEDKAAQLAQRRKRGRKR